MGKVNDQMKPMQIMKTMQDFEKENAKMDMKEEISNFNNYRERYCLILILLF